MSFATPIALFLYNRPAVTQRVFARIAAWRPQQLLIVADGPQGTAYDARRVEAARGVLDQIDWPCDVLANLAERNLGCKRRFSSGLDWVFENVDRAIVLEDDCLPHPDFFPYCEELLERYADDASIMMISGDNFVGHRHLGDESYYFSKYAHIWGWATWRRAWRHYDVAMTQWTEFRDRGLLASIADTPHEAAYWTRLFDGVARGDVDTWDFQWQFAMWSRAGLAVLPRVNLVANLGFGPDATHTRDAASALAALKVYGIGSLTHPRFRVRHTEADREAFSQLFQRDRGLTRLFRRVLARRPPARRVA